MAALEMFDRVTSGLKTAAKAAKSVVLQLSDAERLVRDATTNEKWGPTATQMRELTQLTFSDDTFLPVMNALMKRLSEPGKLWRHVYKALLVIDYMLNEEVAQYCREHVVEIQTLTHFQHIDETDQKDQGINVRERAKVILELLHDEAKLADERKRANAARSKFVGVSNEDAQSMSSTHTSSDERWGMAAGQEYDYHHGYSRPDDQAARLGPRTQTTTTAAPAAEPAAAAPVAAPAATTRQATLLDVTAAPTAPAAPASTSLFTALSTPAAPTQTGGSFFDPRAGSAPTAPAGTSFFDAAPAPAPAPMFDPFATSMPVPAPAPQPVSVAAPVRQQQSAFTGAFGDFEEARPTASGTTAAMSTTTTTTTAAPASGARDLWSSPLVNLDSIGSTTAKAKEQQQAAATKRVPMAALAATGPAMRASTATAPVLTPTPAAPSTTTAAMGRGMPMTYAPAAPGYGMPGYGYGVQQPSQPRPF